MHTLPSRTQVIVVGLGPVGAVMANLLAHQGLDVLVIEAATEIFAAPRAIALDNEALRILQMCGLAEGDFETVAIPHVRMHSPMFGQFGQANSCGPLDGHPKLVTFFQPELETVLRQRLAEQRRVQVCLGMRLEGFSQDEDGVVAQILMSDGRTQTVKADYLIGADGANSTVRRLLGKTFKGRTFPEDWLVVDAKRVPTPFDHVEFICNHRRPVPHMVAPGGRQRWEFKLQAGETREHMESPETIRHLLAPWARDGEIDIERVAVYRFHARVADSFSTGRVFLAGDAAHITPPFVGQGLVAGLRDAGNLCWKLAWVLKGRASPDILDTYNQERRPHVASMVRLATLMGLMVMPGNAVSAFVHHGLMATLRLVPRLRRLFEEMEIKPVHCFKAGRLVIRQQPGKLRRGGLLAQGWVRSGRSAPAVLSDDILGNDLVAIGFGVDPQEHLSPELVRRWQASGGRFVQIDPRGQPCTESNSPRWEDLGGTLVPNYAPPGWLAIVRPDRALLHDGPARDAAALLQTCLETLQSGSRALQPA